MAQLFDFRHPPFDSLSDVDHRRVESAADLAYFPAGSTVMAAGSPVDSLFVIAKGQMAEFEGSECRTVYGAQDSVDPRALISGSTGLDYRALDDTLAWQIPRSLLLELTQRNVQFAAYFYQSVAQKLAALADRPMQRELRPALVAKVQQTYITPPIWLTDDDTVLIAAEQMRARHCSTVLVRGPLGPGVFTLSDLRNVVIDGRNPAETPLGDYAQRTLHTVDEDAHVFEAMLTMARHTVQRVLVTRAGAIVGVLEQVNLLSYLSNNSQIVATQIERAGSVAELKSAADSMTRLVELLHGSGVKVTLIAGLVSELHRKMLARLFALLAPADMLDHVCLLMLGSEGRGEQILPTDQDNALIIADGYDHPQLAEVCEQFNAALITLGYPPCPGDIMARNPFWRRSVHGFRHALDEWVDSASGENVMHLAIWSDAVAVAGQVQLLTTLQQHLGRRVQGNDAYLGRFAFVIEQFDQQPGLLSQWLGHHDTDIDLKKAGIFPIVHGVRTLALAHGVPASNSYQRLDQLASQGHLSTTLAQDLAESLALLQGLYLKTGLQRRQRGEAVSYRISPAQLGTLERDLLKDALKVVRQFRALLRQRYHLQAL
ncbi:CBS domain-containing protein [Andreprevotia lacus DSM 23236]|jgi:CBS domain-containing protein|uniref:CBS domain-containing protein n=1 Tax=Andreprevotia lacus DSM 23236 TaxID=1121001 RepID=A0A1W1XQP9_9NEIS|nr:DUF294 nucleotidyltransferase-like domain-containing protein [Andreprevotia lacus]SMC26197.1 CBS domain-containing protein [Andreprevotia lacus DSM 23236]